MLWEDCIRTMSKVRRSVTLSREILDWIDEQIREKRFSNVSHALEYAVFQLMKKEKEEQRNL